MEVRTVTQRVCPPDLAGAVPAKPQRPPGSALTGDRPTLDWIGSLARWGEGLAARLLDAQRQC